MSNNLGCNVNRKYPHLKSKYFLDIKQQIDKIKAQALRDDVRGIYDNLTIINLALYGLMNEKYELAETAASFNN